MFKDTFNDSVTLYTLLNERRPNKDNLFPIHYRITYNRDRQYYKSGKYCSFSDWVLIIDDTKKGSNKASIRELRKEIQLGHDTIKDNIKAVIENNKGAFSFDKFNNITKKNLSDTVNSAFTAKINNTKAEGKIGTSIYYGCALQSIINFKESIKKPNERNEIIFADITIKWLNDYQKYMLGENKTYTTIGMYCRAIRAMVNEAKTNGIIKEIDYPFGKGKFEIPTGEGRKMALTLEQVGKLMTTDVSETESKYRDLWFFSYLCNGINIGDLCRLKHSDIKNEVISFYRQKTINTSNHKVKIEAVVLPQMKEIINRWNNGNNKSDYLFPFLTGKEDPTQTKKQVQNITRLINKHIKHIAERIGIDEISTYTARHSWATVLKRSGANIAFISEGLGHSDQKTTSTYLDSFEKTEQVKNANLLIPKF
ncbi:MAG: tyrosine-type recombinase/integrase [Bacteroidota bacterium]